MQSLRRTSAELEGLLKALADPTRRAVFERLIAREESVATLTAASRVSQSAVSQHIAVLAKAGLLKGRQIGRSTLYRANPRALEPLIDWVERQNRFWQAALRRLDETLKEIKE